jgi:hypothetical protein
MCNLANLEPWDYFLNESLSVGSPYDIELVHGDTDEYPGEEEPPAEPVQAKDNRQVVSTE